MAAHFGHNTGADGLDEEEGPPGHSQVFAYETWHRCSNITPKTITCQWGVGIDTAWKTLQVTTQAGIHFAVHQLTQ